MKKVIISESQLQKIRNLIYKSLDQRLYPDEGWQNIGHSIHHDTVNDSHWGETYISTADGEGYYNYYSCKYINNMEIEDTECPCLMLQDDDYDFFEKRFPTYLWEPSLVDWWNERCEYPIKAVYRF